jgi:hypothetical protein
MPAVVDRTPPDGLSQGFLGHVESLFARALLPTSHRKVLQRSFVISGRYLPGLSAYFGDCCRGLFRFAFPFVVMQQV